MTGLGLSAGAKRTARCVGLTLAVAAAAVSCGDDATTIDVFAAASLTDAFSELEARFEADNPDVDIRLNLAGSDTLRRQIDDGASVDVFAPADAALLDGLDGDAIIYATNQIEMVANPDSLDDDGVGPTGTNTDWDAAGLVVARCAEGVPCGIATDALLAVQPIDLGVVTFETDVRSVLTKVRLGEADAGFVYRTDRIAAGDEVIALGITAPEASVSLAVISLSDAPDAQAFAAFVASGEAAAVLGELGFGAP